MIKPVSHSINLPIALEVKAATAIKEVKRVLSQEVKPLIAMAPGADKEKLKSAFNTLFQQVHVDFGEELAASTASAEAIDKDGHIYKYAIHRSEAAPEDALIVFDAMNEFFAKAKLLTPEKKARAIENFLLLKDADLQCGRGTKTRLKEIMDPLLPGNRMLTGMYSDSKQRHLVRLAREQGLPSVNVHSPELLDQMTGVTTAQPTRAGRLWIEKTFKADLEEAIAKYIEEDFQKVLDGLAKLFEGGKRPSPNEIVDFQVWHREELRKFLPDSADLRETRYFHTDADTYEYVAPNYGRFIADMFEKVSAVLSRETKTKLLQLNPAFLDVPEVAFDFLSSTAPAIRETKAALGNDAAKFAELMKLRDEKTGDNLLHRLLENHVVVSRLLAEGAVPAELLFETNAKQESPIHKMAERGFTLDLLTVKQYATRHGMGDQYEAAIAKYSNEGITPPETFEEIKTHDNLLAACAKVNDLPKERELLQIAVVSPLGKKFVVDNVDNLKKLSAEQISAIFQVVDPKHNWSWNLAARDRLRKFLETDAEKLSKLSGEQVKLTALAVLKSQEGATFVSSPSDIWFGLSAEAMDSYLTLFGASIRRQGASGIGGMHYGAEFLEKHVIAFQKLDDMQKGETTHLYCQNPEFLESHLKSWLKFNGGQMRWTRKALALHCSPAFLLGNDWRKLTSAQMMKFVESMEAEPGRRTLAFERSKEIRKFDVLQMQQTLNLLRENGGRAFLDAHFADWKKLPADDMKKFVNVFKASHQDTAPIDFGRWKKLSDEAKRVLDKVARAGTGWEELSAILLAPDGPDLHDNLKEFLKDDTYNAVFEMAPSIVASAERVQALHKAAQENQVFKNALKRKPELLTGLGPVEIALTSKMILLPGGRECIGDEQWRTLSPEKMSALVDAYENRELGKIFRAHPGIAGNFGFKEIYETLHLFERSPEDAAYVKEHAGTWENLGLAEIQAMTAVTRSPGFKVL